MTISLAHFIGITSLVTMWKWGMQCAFGKWLAIGWDYISMAYTRLGLVANMKNRSSLGIPCRGIEFKAYKGCQAPNLNPTPRPTT